MKKKIVEELVSLLNSYPVIGIVRLRNLPNKNLQRIRRKLRGKAKIKVARKGLINLAFEKSKDKKMMKLGDYLEGEVGLILTKMDPFKLSVLLEECKSFAPPKANWIPKKDIVVPKGPTPFMPGPMIGKLQSMGLPARIKAGSVIIERDTVFVKAGEEVGPERVDILKQLEINPMKVGLELLGAYDGKLVYDKEMLTIDVEATKKDLLTAYNQAFNLAYNSFYPTNETIKLLLRKVSQEANNLALNAEVFTKETITFLLKKAYNQILAVGFNLIGERPPSERDESQ